MMKVSELWKHFSIFESYNTQIKSVSFDTYQLAEKRPFRSSLIFLKKYTILFNSICQNLENIKKCSRQFDEILTTFQKQICMQKSQIAFNGKNLAFNFMQKISS